MHLVVRAAAIWMYHGHQPLVRRKNVPARGPCRHAEERTGTVPSEQVIDKPESVTVAA